MSYIQIDIGGKPRGLKFNQLAIEIISTHGWENSSTAFIYAMIYGGMVGNSYAKRQEQDYTFEQVCDWIDEMQNKAGTIEAVTNTLSETQVYKELIKTGEEAIKKKAQRKSTLKT